MRNGRLTLACFVLIPALQTLPSCSVLPSQEALHGFPPGTAQRVRQQSIELNDLRGLEAPTPAQQKSIQQLDTRVQEFEREVINTASGLEQQDDWHGAQQVLSSAARILPESRALLTAQTQLETRRQLREERVRMDLEIHRGEQLLKDVEAYQRLHKLKGPGLMNWLELKNFNRKRRASAKDLQEHAQAALGRREYALAQRGLEVARGLYGDDLQPDSGELEKIESDLALTRQKLSPPKRRPARVSPVKDNKVAILKLQEALSAGELIEAQKYLQELQQRSPAPSQLRPLQIQYQAQLDARVNGAIQQGGELYSQGKIEQALDVWREARNLAPENVELQSNIARAEKLLENLRALSAPFGAER
ncbi:hypothetical protein [uncultured Microbulbifer sp.]|uniref:hypothetical protein n=1 Tax=uncultured Microbulbifer sp. TaxID=348147 RepID=UPI002607BDFA|nr:hypothetical protein [uncultured Microbulbifer sp.]